MAAVLTVDELAESLRISRGSAYELVHTGKVRSIRVGRATRIPAEAVESFLAGTDTGDES